MVYISFYNFLIRNGFPGKFFFVAGLTWIAFALVEIVDPSIPSYLSPYRTTPDRGLTSLAPEPTFFGIFLLFFAWIIIAKSGDSLSRKDKVLVALMIGSIFVLAQSSMVILYLATAAMIYAIFAFVRTVSRLKARKTHFVVMLLLIAFAMIAFYGINSFLVDSRVAKLLSQVMDVGIAGLVAYDASISARIEDVFLSLHGFVFHNGVPGGLDTFEATKDVLRGQWNGLFWYSSFQSKIMSWLGALLYELGWFGVIAFGAILHAARRSGVTWSEITIFTVVLLGAIPVAFPLVPVLIATWVYKGRGLRSSRGRHGF
ncbi:hypothetical protein [Celeribacter indicus]|uniref:O-antigen polymerase n=1 Tax=Celeribacter indicus TaxID=1208324 RepID=A0A0B5E4K6_9RHOB|nr:hypothetical protein [Celeribacter indicus]AJE47302.1 hypothetical protein P73_2587 [Celeribacter indicus]SDW02876.1 hypothetical protein SAMN05443573_101141 [Celeribacter indicus]